MVPNLHPHWNASDDSTELDSHAVMPQVAGVTVSRRPAAIAGIGVVLVVGGFFFQGQDLFPAQLVQETQTSVSSTKSSVIASSKPKSSSAKAVSSEPAVKTVVTTAVAESSESFAPSEALAPIEELPTNPYVHGQVNTEVHESAPLLPPPVATYGKGKPPHQPSTGLPLGLLVSSSLGALTLYAKVVGRNIKLYK